MSKGIISQSVNIILESLYEPKTFDGQDDLNDTVLINFPSEDSKTKFSNLLIEIKGDRDLNKFADELDASPAYISRLIRKLIPNIPSEEFLTKISNVSCGRFSLEHIKEIVAIR